MSLRLASYNLAIFQHRIDALAASIDASFGSEFFLSGRSTRSNHFMDDTGEVVCKDTLIPTNAEMTTKVKASVRNWVKAAQ